MAYVEIIKETAENFGAPEGWVLLFQWCRYVYDKDTAQHGYRFIWRRPQSEGGSLQAARGQARIPSLDVARKLMEQAKEEGWGDYDGDEE